MTITDQDQDQINRPLASKSQPRSDEEEFGGFAPFKRRHEQTSKCFVYLLAAVVAISAFLLVFALIFLRASTPDAELRSVAVKTLTYTSYAFNSTSNATTTAPTFNVTLTAVIALDNSNFGHFNYDNSTASVFYAGVEVGRGTVAPGRVGGRGEARMSVTVDARSERRFENSTSFRSDMDSGMLKLTSYGELRGRVYLMNAIKKQKISIVSCSMILNLRNRTIEELACL